MQIFLSYNLCILLYVWGVGGGSLPKQGAVVLKWIICQTTSPGVPESISCLSGLLDETLNQVSSPYDLCIGGTLH